MSLENDYKTLEELLQALMNELEWGDTFTITFRNGVIAELQILKITQTN